MAAKPTVLVTGASGFLGSHCVKALLDEGYQVRGTVRSLEDEPKVKAIRDLDRNGRLELFEADLTSAKGWHSLLASGDQLSSVATAYRIGKSTAAAILAETTKAIWEALSPDYVKAPKNPKDWLDIAELFESKWNFPHCLGAIDGKHVVVQAPPNSGSLFYNYKGSFSIVLMAVVDANCLFRVVNVGHFGRWSDGGIFSQTAFGRRLLEGRLDLPLPAPLPGSPAVAPFAFVADEAFPAKENLLRPYPGRNLGAKERLFNYRLSRARRIVENAFGILAARWRIFRKPIIALPHHVDSIVKATIALHNFLRLTDPTVYVPPSLADSDNSVGNWRVETEGDTGLLGVGRVGGNRTLSAAAQVRETFADYFLNEGAVSWQHQMI